MTSPTLRRLGSPAGSSGIDVISRQSSLGPAGQSVAGQPIATTTGADLFQGMAIQRNNDAAVIIPSSQHFSVGLDPVTRRTQQLVEQTRIASMQVDWRNRLSAIIHSGIVNAVGAAFIFGENGIAVAGGASEVTGAATTGWSDRKPLGESNRYANGLKGSAAGWGVGSASGGATIMVNDALLRPVVSEVVASIVGRCGLRPLPAEVFYPDPDPAAEDVEQQWEAVRTGRREIQKAQQNFNVDGISTVITGCLSYALMHTLRFIYLGTKDRVPGSFEAGAISGLTTFVASLITNSILPAWKGSKTAPARAANGDTLHLPLFELTTSDVPIGQRLRALPGNVATAVGAAGRDMTRGRSGMIDTSKGLMQTFCLNSLLMLALNASGALFAPAGNDVALKTSKPEESRGWTNMAFAGFVGYLVGTAVWYMGLGLVRKLCGKSADAGQAKQVFEQSFESWVNGHPDEVRQLVERARAQMRSGTDPAQVEMNLFDAVAPGWLETFRATLERHPQLSRFAKQYDALDIRSELDFAREAAVRRVQSGKSDGRSFYEILGALVPEQSVSILMEEDSFHDASDQVPQDDAGEDHFYDASTYPVPATTPMESRKFLDMNPDPEITSF